MNREQHTLIFKRPRGEKYGNTGPIIFRNECNKSAVYIPYLPRGYNIVLGSGARTDYQGGHNEPEPLTALLIMPQKVA